MKIETPQPDQALKFNGVEKIISNYAYLDTEVLDILKKQCRNDYFVSTLEDLEELDPNTVKHILETANLAYVVGKEKKFSDEEIKDLVESAICHDLGKVAIEEEVLKKPGKLNEAELRIMREHADFGKNIAQKISNGRISRIAGGVHTCLRENPYPEELKFASEEEKSKAKTLAIIDSFHAITDKRHYKESEKFETAAGFITAIGERLSDLDEEDEKTINLLFDFYSKKYQNGKFYFNGREESSIN